VASRALVGLLIPSHTSMTILEEEENLLHGDVKLQRQQTCPSVPDKS
jgi:hypothetical protein